jgi:signal transduction histidine kinase
MNMSLASDQNLDTNRLSANAQKMQALRDKVLEEWVARLRRNVKEAEHLSHPILINTFPAIYDNLAEAITPGYPRATAEEGNTIASEHGGERARLTKYNAQAVISEYQQLRWVIFDVLKSNGVQLIEDEIFIINASIDESIRESVSAFAMVQSALRERFVAALTHDLRTPLATAHAAAELIRHSSDLTRIKEFSEHITSNLGRMDQMIQELLDSAIFQTGERLRLRLEETDILKIANEVSAQFTATHGSRFEVIGTSVTGWWDQNALKRTMENLVGNAIKYGAADTAIRIKIDANNGRMLLTVHNEGEAIPTENLEDIFQVFHRSVSAKEGDSQGWGIGLPYVRSVAESHGGSVSVDSATGRGTTFLIDIPQDARPFLNAPTFGEKLA